MLCPKPADAGALDDNRPAFRQLKAAIGPLRTRLFDDLVERRTPSNVLRAFFFAFREALQLHVKSAFRQVLMIGSANATQLQDTPIKWASWHVQHMIVGASLSTQEWVVSCCDGLGWDPNDFLRRPEWRDPMQALMHPALAGLETSPLPWNSNPQIMVIRVLKVFTDDFVASLEATLETCAEEAALEFSGSTRLNIGLQGASQRRATKQRTPSNAERKRREAIYGAVQAKLKGLKYCRILDSRNLQPPQVWIDEGCPEKYAAAYASGKKWQKRIQDEKYRYQKKLAPLPVPPTNA